MIISKYDNEIKILAEETISIYTIRLREDGILHGHVTTGGKWNPEDYKLLFPAIGKMVDFKKVPVYITYDKFVFPTAESSEYWANPDKTCPYFSAEAQILDSLPLKILGNFYLKFNKPLRPTRIFNKEEDSISWLKTFL